MDQIRSLIQRREYVVDADKVASAILVRLLAGDDAVKDAD